MSYRFTSVKPFRAGNNNNNTKIGFADYPCSRVSLSDICLTYVHMPIFNRSR